MLMLIAVHSAIIIKLQGLSACFKKNTLRTLSVLWGQLISTEKLCELLMLKEKANAPLDILFDGHGQLIGHDRESLAMASASCIWSFSYLPQVR